MVAYLTNSKTQKALEKNYFYSCSTVSFLGSFIILCLTSENSLLPNTVCFFVFLSTAFLSTIGLMVFSVKYHLKKKKTVMPMTPPNSLEKKTLPAISSEKESPKIETDYMTRVSTLHERAEKFVENQILEIKPLLKRWSILKEPHSDKIKQVASLHAIFLEKFKNILSMYPNNPWEKEVVVGAAVECFYIAYCYSRLTIEDVASEIGYSLSDKGKDLNQKQKEFMDLLTDKNSYSSQAFFCCSTIYHYMRGGIEMFPVSPGEEPRLLYPKDFPHDDLFYTWGSKQNDCRLLYNYFGTQLEKWISKEALNQKDSRFVNWYKSDTRGHRFSNAPDIGCIKTSDF